MFLADLHIHSRFSRACSKDAEIPSLAWWAARKGVTVVGTGDFTHPAWAAHLADSLVSAEPGLLRLAAGPAARLWRSLPPSCDPEVRFLLSTEISTIYKRDGATRKVHHLLYAPTFEAAAAITTALAKVGNLASDGRPILGLDSRHLLEITLNAGPGCFLIPAHIWTPWFAVLGSKSGFDAVPDCYLDLAEHVFAVETGLSSDPAMNWICSALDHYRLVSNSDAHSPPMLGREATRFSTALDYFAMLRALRTGQGLAGTLNFFPEGGRYHLDGHRKCGVRLSPAQSVRLAGICPKCGKPLTIGVLHRVSELADRPEGHRPPGAAAAANLVSLPEIIGELRGSGRQSKTVTTEVDRLVAALGPELHILCDADPADIRRAGGAMVAEAITRLRAGQVIKEAGYDGEYGVIRLFRPDELAGAEALFALPGDAARPATAPPGTAPPGTAPPGETAAEPPRPGPFATDGTAGGTRGPAATGGPAANTGPAATDGSQPDGTVLHAGPAHGGSRPGPAPAAAAVRHGAPTAGDVLLAGLDPEQREAALAGGPLMILAGPGTGKTRTLTHRIAVRVAERGVAAEECLALTFTRRAAAEMRDRLAGLLPGQADRVMVTTFHGLGLAILREHGELAGLQPGFTVADDRATLALAAEAAGSVAAGRRLLAAAARDPDAAGQVAALLSAHGLVTFDGLISLPLALLRERPGLARALRARWPCVSVDEYQDTDASQYALLRLLTGDGAGLTVIGDPDQAIYGFRGADVGFFLSFAQDYPGARTVALSRNYRSSPAIVTGAMQAVAPATLVPGRRLTAVAGPGTGAPSRITVHEAADERAEAAWIARAIDRLLGGVSFLSLDSGRADGHAGGRLALADFAVLYRTGAQAGPLGDALTRAGLPYQKRSHDLLARRTAVPDIVAEMSRAGGGAIPGSAIPGGAIPGGAIPGGAIPGGGGVPGLLEAAVRRLAARVPAQARRKGGPQAPAGDAGQPVPGTVMDVLAAGEVLAPLARRCGGDLDRFLTEIALGAEADALDPRADAITLLTMHAAKGLEFSVVFVTGCERGLLPLSLPGKRPGGDPGPAGPDPAEERRLLFVAMTRARAHLVLSYAAQRRRHAGAAGTGPSPFLGARESRLLDRVSPPRPRRPVAIQPRLL